MTPESHVRLEGSKRGEEPDAPHVGDVDSASPIELTVTVHPEDFAHASEEVKRVLGRFGLSVEEAYPATGSLAVSGSAGQIEDAFRAGLGLTITAPTASSVAAKVRFTSRPTSTAWSRACSGWISAGWPDGSPAPARLAARAEPAPARGTRAALQLPRGTR